MRRQGEVKEPQAEAAGAAAPGPGLAPWGVLALATAAACGAVAYAVWPGLMSYDSLAFYREALHGVTRSTWPPMYAYLIQMTRALGGDYGDLLIAQNAIVFGVGGFLAMRWAGASSAARLTALGLFLACFLIVPTLIGTSIVLWNMTAMAGFALIGAALQSLAVERRRIGWALGAAVAYGACFANRYDAAFLLAPAVGALVIWPTGCRSRWRQRAMTACVLGLSLALAWVSFGYRLPDLRRLEPNEGVTIIQRFDLIGTSALCGEDLLPPEMSANHRVKVADIRAHYDPRHLNLSLAAKPGLQDFRLAGPRAVGRYWIQAVTEHPGCYLRHRAAVFREQMGLMPGEVFYPTHGGIDPNPFGFRFSHPNRAQAMIEFVLAAAPAVWRRAFWLYVAGAMVVGGLAMQRDPRAVPMGVFALGGLLYAASRLFVSPAADARYIFPSNVVMAIVIAAAAPTLFGRLVIVGRAWCGRLIASGAKPSGGARGA